MHMIDTSNNRANMAYIGAVPWHGLGAKLTPNSDLEIWCQEAGMDYTIERSRVVYRWGSESGQITVLDDKVVLWRSDTKAPLAVVSARFKNVQPEEVLEFFRDLVDSTGDYTLETAGVLNGGSRYWALAKYKQDLNFGSDIVKPYLLLATACDGSMATTAQHTTIRVVCNNTLQMSLSSDSISTIKVRHSTHFDANRVKSQLGIVTAMTQYKQDVETLIDTSLNNSQAVEVLVNVLAVKDEKDNITNEKHVKRVVGEVMASRVSAPGADMETTSGTAWGLVNAVSHYVDFKARARDNNNRFNSGQFGLGAKFKQSVAQNLLKAA